MERLLDLAGQRFIVTGAARGIGLAISDYFHKLGAHVSGWDLDDALTRVHISNLSKLDDNLRPIKREDGKVIKGPNYKKPTLIDLV